MPLLSAFLVALLASAHADPLWVTLGPQNASHGLTILSQGDGQNAPDSVAGSACRSLAPKSCYLYVQADPAAIAPGNHEAFVTVEYFDRDAGLVNVEYDRAVDEPTLQTSYTLADDVIVLGGSGKWMRGILRLADARFGKGQNWQADFRLRSWSLTVRRVEVSLTRPPDYVPGGTAPEVLEAFRAHAGPGMEVVFGCVAASAGEANVPTRARVRSQRAAGPVRATPTLEPSSKIHSVASLAGPAPRRRPLTLENALACPRFADATGKSVALRAARSRLSR